MCCVQLWLKRNVKVDEPSGGQKQSFQSAQGSQQGPKIRAEDLEPPKLKGVLA